MGVSCRSSRYEGPFLDELKHGEGREETSDGMIYMGAFAKDQKNGNGTLIFKDGSQFKGGFKDDKMDVCLTDSGIRRIQLGS